MRNNNNIVDKKRFVKNRCKVGHIECYERAMIIDRWYRCQQVGGGIRKEIKNFTKSSKNRLKFRAENAEPPLISQFAMTYHNRLPQGRQLKSDLNLFLTRFRKRWKSGYLWILEFQTRKAPHLHLFLTLPYDKKPLHAWLAKTWNEIVEPGNDKHLKVHLHKDNFIPWEMFSGGYLCKYLGKEAQKCVPEDFEGVGRFWGSSRGLVPSPLVLTPEQIDENYGEGSFKSTLRICYKHHEKNAKKYKRKIRSKNALGRYKLPNGNRAFEKCIEYMDKKTIEEMKRKDG